MMVKYSWIHGLIIIWGLLALSRPGEAQEVMTHKLLLRMHEFVQEEFGKDNPDVKCSFESKNYLKCYSNAKEFEFHKSVKGGYDFTKKIKSFGPNPGGFVLAVSVHASDQEISAPGPHIYKNKYWETYMDWYQFKYEDTGVSFKYEYGKNISPEYLKKIRRWLQTYAEHPSLVEKLESRSGRKKEASKLDFTEKSSIVFMGDSLIAFNDWNSFFDRSDIVNLGVAGDQIRQTYRRLDEAIALNPSKIFIMVGINDKPTQDNIDLMVQNYRKIFTMLNQELPNCQIYIHSLLPINYKKFQETFAVLMLRNEDIVNVNNRIKLLATEFNIVYIDLYSHFLVDGELRADLTKDGLHLSRKGYLQWRPLIEDFIK